MYKLKQLIEQNVDFTEIYPEKQASVRENTGLDFDLNGIVLFLQKQTNNFTIDNTIAKDLDEAIFKLYEQSQREKSPEKQPEKTEEESRQEWLDAIQALEALGEENLDEQERDALMSLRLILES